jgi:DNA-binding FadR family transcriptional regulator
MLVQQLYVQKLPGAIRRAYDFHKKILLHLEEQDPDAAATAMGEHLDDVGTASVQDMSGSEEISVTA